MSDRNGKLTTKPVSLSWLSRLSNWDWVFCSARRSFVAGFELGSVQTCVAWIWSTYLPRPRKYRPILTRAYILTEAQPRSIWRSKYSAGISKAETNKSLIPENNTTQHLIISISIFSSPYMRTCSNQLAMHVLTSMRAYMHACTYHRHACKSTLYCWVTGSSAWSDCQECDWQSTGHWFESAIDFVFSVLF